MPDDDCTLKLRDKKVKKYFIVFCEKCIALFIRLWSPDAVTYITFLRQWPLDEKNSWRSGCCWLIHWFQTEHKYKHVSLLWVEKSEKFQQQCKISLSTDCGGRKCLRVYINLTPNETRVHHECTDYPQKCWFIFTVKTTAWPPWLSLDRSCSDFPLAEKKGGEKVLFCKFSLAGCHSGPGYVTAAVKQAMSFSGLLSDASPLTEIIFELHISDQIHDAWPSSINANRNWTRH